MPPQSWIGTSIGDRWRVVKLLASGGYAEVYLALDTATTEINNRDRHDAVKIIKMRQGSRLNRVMTEANNLRALAHPHVIRYHHSAVIQPPGETDRALYIVMELAQSSLEDLKRSGPISSERLRVLMLGWARGLAFLHNHEHVGGDGRTRGYLHCDIKPGNLLIAGGIPKLGDFGLVRELPKSWDAPEPFVATLYYVSPRRLRGEPPSADDDLRALGICMLESLTGKPCFTGFNNSGQLVNMIKAAQPTVPDSLPAPWRRIIQRCLNGRITASQLVSELERDWGEAAGSSDTPADPPGDATQPMKASEAQQGTAPTDTTKPFVRPGSTRPYTAPVTTRPYQSGSGEGDQDATSVGRASVGRAVVGRASVRSASARDSVLDGDLAGRVSRSGTYRERIPTTPPDPPAPPPRRPPPRPPRPRRRFLSLRSFLALVLAVAATGFWFFYEDININIGASVSQIAFTPDQKKLVVLTRDGIVYTVDTIAGRTISRIDANFQEYLGVSSSRISLVATNDRTVLAAINDSGALHVWNNKTYNTKEISLKSSTGIALSSDGKTIAAVSPGGNGKSTITLVDSADGKKKKSFTTTYTAPYAVAFCSNDHPNTLLALGPEGVTPWNTTTGDTAKTTKLIPDVGKQDAIDGLSCGSRSQFAVLRRYSVDIESKTDILLGDYTKRVSGGKKTLSARLSCTATGDHILAYGDIDGKVSIKRRLGMAKFFKQVELIK